MTCYDYDAHYFDWSVNLGGVTPSEDQWDSPLFCKTFWLLDLKWKKIISPSLVDIKKSVFLPSNFNDKKNKKYYEKRHPS